MNVEIFGGDDVVTEVESWPLARRMYSCHGEGEERLKAQRGVMRGICRIF